MRGISGEMWQSSGGPSIASPSNETSRADVRRFDTSTNGTVALGSLARLNGSFLICDLSVTLLYACADVGENHTCMSRCGKCFGSSYLLDFGCTMVFPLYFLLLLGVGERADV